MKDKPFILLVDDDPNISRLVQLYLEKEGFEVKTADRGDDALAMFRKMPPDLILQHSDHHAYGQGRNL